MKPAELIKEAQSDLEVSVKRAIQLFIENSGATGVYVTANTETGQLGRGSVVLSVSVNVTIRL